METASGISRFQDYDDSESDNHCSRCDLIIDTGNMNEPTCHCITDVEQMSYREFAEEYDNLPTHVRVYFSPPLLGTGEPRIEFLHSVRRWVVATIQNGNYQILSGFSTRDEAQKYLDQIKV